MLLSEYLSEHGGKKVYIGSGSAYFYMDEATEKTADVLTHIGEHYKAEFVKILSQSKKRYEQMPETISNAQDRYNRLPSLIEEHRAKLHIAERSLNVMKRSGKESLIEEAQAKYDSIYEITTRLINVRKRMPRRIERLKHEYKIYPAKMAKLEQKIDNFKPFAERKVKRAYVSIINGANICIIDGQEAGKYWFEQEYHNPELLKSYEEDEYDTERTGA